MAKTVDLWCLIIGQTDPFQITARTDNNMHNVKELIHEKNKDILRDISPPRLTLWKYMGNEPSEPSYTFAERVLGNISDFSTSIAMELLHPKWKVSAVFPCDDSGPRINIIVEPPPAAPMYVRKQDVNAIFDSDEVQTVLMEMNYRIWAVSCSTPGVALVEHVEIRKKYYLKFVPTPRNKEISILEHLNAIDSPFNHTVRPLSLWPVTTGKTIVMEDVGCRLDGYKNLEESLVSVAQQLIEGVAFMHDRGVAHLDLKPDNILIHPNNEQLTIIDFSVSEFVEDENDLFEGFAGTEGLTAPEVGREEYSPIRADIWSCGNVIRKMCEMCNPSSVRTVLLEMSNRLMDENPENRPSLSKAVQLMEILSGSAQNQCVWLPGAPALNIDSMPYTIPLPGVKQE